MSLSLKTVYKRIKDAKSTGVFLSSGFLVITLLVSLLVFFAQNAFLDRAISISTDKTKTAIIKQTLQVMAAVQRMSERWNAEQRSSEIVWKVDAKNYIRDSAGFTVMTWIDENLESQWQVRKEESGAHPPEFLSNPVLNKQLENFKESQKPQFSSLSQSSNGRYFVHLLQPLHRSEEFDGFIAVSIDIQNYLNSVLGDPEKNGFLVQVKSRDVLVFDNTSHLVDLKGPKNQFQLDIDSDGAGWTFVVYPTKEVVSIFQTPIPWIIALSGLLISALVYVVMASRSRVKLQAKNLTKEIHYRKQVQSQLDHMVNHDPLTLLPNRAYINIYLENKIKECLRMGKQLALLILDVDYFKDINDSWGHHTGDRLLKLMASRLQYSLNRDHLLGRMDGDEFVICLEGKLIKESMFIHADDLLKALKKPYEIEGETIRVTGSIGIAYLGDHGDTVTELFSKASAASYQAKKAGRDTFCVFDSKLEGGDVSNRSQLIQSLNRGLVADEFDMVFQPRYDIKTGSLVSAEALLRWHHNGKILTPEAFLTVAEETGLIIEISKKAFAKAFCHYQNLFGNNPTIMLSVNVSAKQLEHPDFLNDLFSVMDQYDFPSKKLEIELTEQALINNFNASVSTLNLLHQAGISIAVDDFGTGYSSLSYLKNFPVDVLKIDRSFIKDIEKDKGGLEIVRAIIGMGNSLNMQVVAEGVESSNQLRILRKEGCHQAQGFYLSKPLAAKEFKSLFLNKKKTADVFKI